MTDVVVTDDSLCREYVHDNSREPWCYPKPRDKSDFVKPSRDVSDARKEDLHIPWVENELYPELGTKDIIYGAFDASALGTGGHHVIPLRRPKSRDLPVQPDVEPPTLAGPMVFSARQTGGLGGCSADKYHRTILDGDVNTRGLKFHTR